MAELSSCYSCSCVSAGVLSTRELEVGRVVCCLVLLHARHGMLVSCRVWVTAGLLTQGQSCGCAGHVAMRRLLG